MTVRLTTPQPQNSDVRSVVIGRYSDVPLVSIDLYRHLAGDAESGVGIAYTDRHGYSDQRSDSLGVTYTDT